MKLPPDLVQRLEKLEAQFRAWGRPSLIFFEEEAVLSFYGRTAKFQREPGESEAAFESRATRLARDKCRGVDLWVIPYAVCKEIDDSI